MNTMSVCPKCHALNNVDTNKAIKNEAQCGKCQTPLKLHGLVSNISYNDMNRIIKKAPVKVVVDFWASWCGPCKVYGPTFQEASIKHQDVIFLKVDTEANPEVGQYLGIRSIPTTIVFQNGQEIKRQPGALNLEMLSSLLR